MPFAYYDRLSTEDQATYRASDAVTSIRLPGAQALAPTVEAIRAGLERDDRAAIERAARRLTAAVCAALGTRPPTVDLLEVRPRFTGGELHGLYTVDVRGRSRILVWMRTARHARVVAFRTFLRTLLHEIGHHVDFRVLRLPTSFHTEGFFKRESSLFHQLVPDARPARLNLSGRGAGAP
jgi:hypothetical protein